MFSKNIIYLRKKNNLTQEELGNKLNVSRQTISKWEKGEVVPDSYNLIEISKCFSIKVQDLIMTDISEEKIVSHELINDISRETNEPIKEDSQPKKSKKPIIIALQYHRCSLWRAFADNLVRWH